MNTLKREDREFRSSIVVTVLTRTEWNVVTRRTCCVAPCARAQKFVKRPWPTSRTYPPETIEAVRASLASKTLPVAGESFELTRALPHSRLAAVSVMAKSLGLVDLLGPACKKRGITYALILARVG